MDWQIWTMHLRLHVRPNLTFNQYNPYKHYSGTSIKLLNNLKNDLLKRNFELFPFEHLFYFVYYSVKPWDWRPRLKRKCNLRFFFLKNLKFLIKANFASCVKEYLLQFCRVKETCLTSSPTADLTLYHQGSISPTSYAQLLRQQSCARKVQTYNVSTKKLCAQLTYVKDVHRTLVKLTPDLTLYHQILTVQFYCTLVSETNMSKNIKL